MDSELPAKQASNQDLEKQRLQWEIESQKQELELKKRDLELRLAESRRSAWTSPLFLSIVAAAIGLVGNAIVTAIQGYEWAKVRDGAPRWL
jgi:hypothetical protein